jgi:hypothetical protein
LSFGLAYSLPSKNELMRTNSPYIRFWLTRSKFTRYCMALRKSLFLKIGASRFMCRPYTPLGQSVMMRARRIQPLRTAGKLKSSFHERAEVPSIMSSSPRRR